MYNNINNNIAIEYDPEIISKIKEIIKEGFEKLKSFVKSKNKSSFDIYFELDEKFNDIALRLEKFEFLNEELDYFLSISDKILYIIHSNCINPTFGHCDFALELFNLFKEIWDKKIRLITNYSHLELERYNEFKNSFKIKYGKYRHKFYLEIHKSTGEFSEKEIYKLHESLRE